MNILDEYFATSQFLMHKEFSQDKAVDAIFNCMAREISRAIIKRKKELPNEDCLFVLTCKIYKLDEYIRAHPDVFKKGGEK